MVGSDPAWCPACVQFISQAIDQLLNIILNAGVIGSCGTLCNLLPNQIEATICDLLCDYVGIEAFIDLIQDADPDPIWICEEVTVCPITDNAKAQITNLNVSPKSGPQGTTFTINVFYTVTSSIGTGDLELAVIPPDAEPFGDDVLIVAQQPNQYRASFNFQAQPSEQEPFDAGNYGVQVAICEGSCGSIHSHSYTLSIANASFVITQ